MKLLVINGPNLNLLGLREPAIYGNRNYAALLSLIRSACEAEGIDVDFFQSNHEGAIVDAIQAAYGVYGGIVISDVDSREPFRQVSYAGMACIKTYKGLGFDGYVEAVRFLKSYLTAEK